MTRNFAFAQILGATNCNGNDIKENPCESLKPMDILDNEAEVSKAINESLEKIGASEKCKKSFDLSDKKSEFYAEYKRQKSSGGFMGIGSGQSASGEKYENKNSELNTKMRQEGCGNLYANITNINKLNRKLSCYLNESVECNSVRVDNRASVSFTVRAPEPQEWLEELKIKADLVKTLNDSNTVLTQSMKDTPHLLKSLQLSNAKIIEDITKTMEIGANFDGVTVSVFSGTSLKQVKQVSDTVKEKMTETLKEVAITTAEHNLEQQTGLSSLDPNTKRVITERVNAQSDTIKKNITTSLKDSDVNISNSSSITFNVPRNLTMTDSVIDANAHINIIQQSVSKHAKDIGLIVSNDLMKEASTNTTTKQTSEGIDISGLIDSLGQANRIAQQRSIIMPSSTRNTSESSKSNNNIMIIIVIAVVIVLAIILMSGNEPPPSEYEYY